MTRNRIGGIVLCFAAAIVSGHAQGIRSHTRPTKGTAVSESQAADLTLTLNQAAVRPIQVWIRTAGTIDKSRKVLTSYIDPVQGKLVEVGQRARAFTADSKSSMFQAWVTRVVPEAHRVRIEVTLSATGLEDSRNYVVEIVSERGEFFSVPNESIIEEGKKHIVYVQEQPGNYVPQEIDIGLQGERYTQVLDGLDAGEQVVTFGSFFIDSEYKLKGPSEPPASTTTTE